MAGFTGEEEAANILARLSALCGGRVFEFVPDDAQLALNPDGTIKPFLVATFGESVPKEGRGQRGVGENEAQRPYVLPFTVACITGNGTDSRLVTGSVNRLMVGGWKPSVNNSGEIGKTGGTHFTTLDANSKPSRWFRIPYFEFDIGLERA